MTEPTPAQLEAQSRQLAQMLGMQNRLQRQLDEAERLIKVMREDSKTGCVPRYHGHLRQHLDQLHDNCVEMTAFGIWA